MNPLYLSPVRLACYDNEAFIPELWARESIAILFENMVIAGLVHRDFEQEIRNFGDTVHTRRPDESKIMRRTDATAAADLIQATNAVDVPVVFNQWFNQTFVIKPGEMSKSFLDLVQVYLAPRMKAMARSIDRTVLGRCANGFGLTPATRAGRLGGLTRENVYQACVEVDQIFNQNKAYQEGRNLILSPSAKAQLLLCDRFVKAIERGDGGETLATAQIGTVLNLNTYMSQNVNCVLTGADVATCAVGTAAAAETATALNVTVTGEAGEYLVIAGNDQPTYMTDKTSGAVVLNEPLKYGIATGAAGATQYKHCAVYAPQSAGWSKGVVLYGYTHGKAPQVGQLLALADAADGVTHRVTYTIIEAQEDISGTYCTVLLDRPLEADIAKDTTHAYPGPYGSINIALHKKRARVGDSPLGHRHWCRHVVRRSVGGRHRRQGRHAGHD